MRVLLLLVRVLLLARRWPSSCCVPMWWPWRGSSVNVLFEGTEGSTLKPDHLPKAPASTTIILGSRFQRVNFGGHKLFVYDILPPSPPKFMSFFCAKYIHSIPTVPKLLTLVPASTLKPKSKALSKYRPNQTRGTLQVRLSRSKSPPAANP